MLLPFYDAHGLSCWEETRRCPRTMSLNNKRSYDSRKRNIFIERSFTTAVFTCVGYVVEFALKARICKILKLHEYPDKGEVGRIFKTHDFAVLKLFAGLQEEMTIAKNKPLFDNWSTATAWKPEQRYSPIGTYGAREATDVLSSIKDKPNGVLTWLSKRW